MERPTTRDTNSSKFTSPSPLESRSFIILSMAAGSFWVWEKQKIHVCNIIELEVGFPQIMEKELNMKKIWMIRYGYQRPLAQGPPQGGATAPGPAPEGGFHYLALGPAPCLVRPCPCYTIRGPWSLQGPSLCLKLFCLGCMIVGNSNLQKARQLFLHQQFELFATQGCFATLCVGITVKHHDQSLHCSLQIRRHFDCLQWEKMC